MLPGNPILLTTLEQEVEEVEGRLSHALDELRPPLGELVRSQLSEMLSRARVGTILAGGYGRPDTAQLQEQRILLAAALEMLFLALHIHKLLLQRSDDKHEQSMDRSWMGSIILAGDYCFSRAASLVAQTNEPQAVAQFADGLENANEGHLRRLFQNEAADFAEESELIDAGLKTATRLAGLTTAEQARCVESGRALRQNAPITLQDVPAHQVERWRQAQALADESRGR